MTEPIRTWEEYRSALATRADAREPSLGYPETTLHTCTCAGGANLPHHERCPVRHGEEGIMLPGWTCLGCGAFNGDAKERLASCRCCELPRGQCANATCPCH